MKFNIPRIGETYRFFEDAEIQFMNSTRDLFKALGVPNSHVAQDSWDRRYTPVVDKVTLPAGQVFRVLQTYFYSNWGPGISAQMLIGKRKPRFWIRRDDLEKMEIEHVLP